MMTTSSTTTTTCPLCWEDHDQPLQVLCSTISSDSQPHECCQHCAVRWIQKSEQASRGMPRCPFCRLCLSQNRVEAILGRPFQATAAAEFDEQEDDNLLLTRQWLSERTRQCLHCQSYILKVEGTCNLMECLCGFRFCYECGSSSSGSAQQLPCQCLMDSSQANTTGSSMDVHYYWDNVFDRPASRAPPPCASVVATTSTTAAEAEAGGGAIDLRGHLQRRRVEYKRQNDVAERWFWSFMMVIIISGVAAHWFMLQDDDEGMSLMEIDASTMCKAELVWWHPN